MQALVAEAVVQDGRPSLVCPRRRRPAVHGMPQESPSRSELCARDILRELEGRDGHEDSRRRIVGLLRHVTRYEDVLASIAEGLLERLEQEPAAVRTLRRALLDLLLAEEGLSRRARRMLSDESRALREEGRTAEAERLEQESLILAELAA